MDNNENISLVFKQETPMNILLQDLKSSKNLYKNVDEINLITRLIKVVESGYIKKESDFLVNVSFEFYTVLSKKMGVPTNLISENLTNAESFFINKNLIVK